jgi:hypothetical protein
MIKFQRYLKEQICTSFVFLLSHSYQKTCKAVKKGCILVLKWYWVISFLKKKIKFF